MRQAFIDWSPHGATAGVVAQADEICAGYAAQGYDLTLRQLYYQFVARGLIPNTQRDYKRLGSIVDKARLAGLLDWGYIVDRTRNVYGTDGADTSPEDAIRTAALGYHRALWATQPNHVEVWVEKEALAGVVQRAAQPPPNPAKATDARFAGYLAEFGEESWELDALDPATLHDLIRDEVLALRDEDLWAEATERQEAERSQLQTVSDQWDEVLDYIGVTD